MSPMEYIPCDCILETFLYVEAFVRMPGFYKNEADFSEAR